MVEFSSNMWGLVSVFDSCTCTGPNSRLAGPDDSKWKKWRAGFDSIENEYPLEKFLRIKFNQVISSTLSHTQNN